MQTTAPKNPYSKIDTLNTEKLVSIMAATTLMFAPTTAVKFREVEQPKIESVDFSQTTSTKNVDKSATFVHIDYNETIKSSVGNKKGTIYYNVDKNGVTALTQNDLLFDYSTFPMVRDVEFQDSIVEEVNLMHDNLISQRDSAEKSFSIFGYFASVVLLLVAIITELNFLVVIPSVLLLLSLPLFIAIRRYARRLDNDRAS